MQIQVKPEIGLTFANALRSILRHDPDVMMIGEVRDMETAELAIRTALTGHLIFSTLHTNDSCSGATRLIDIGIEPYLVASSVNAFISQRLVRVICPACKEARHEQTELPACFRGIPSYIGRGCDMCKKIGYRGMTAIYEILLLDDAIKELVMAKVSVVDIRKKAAERGLRTILTAGIEKIRLGITTPEEVMRVTESG
jgi:general secretion pathway protein E